MGQKIRPDSFRIGIYDKWRSRWCASKKDFGKFLVEDYKIREYIKKKYSYGGIPKVEIERTGEEIVVSLYTARPGIIIGRKGTNIDKIRMDLEELIGKRIAPIKIIEVDSPETEAQLVAQAIAEQLEKNVSYRRAMKKSVDLTMAKGAEGIKIKVSGRLAGAEIARTEGMNKGKIPLQTLAANIDYGFVEARTKYGRIGVKVWIYKGKYKHLKEKEHGAEDAKEGETPKDPTRQD